MKKLILGLSLFGAGLFLVAGMASAQGSNMQKSGTYSANSSRAHYINSINKDNEKRSNVTAKVNSGKDMISHKVSQPKIAKSTVTKKVTVVKKQTIVINRTFGHSENRDNKMISNKKQVQSKNDNKRNIIIHNKNIKTVGSNQDRKFHQNDKRFNDADKRFADSRHMREPNRTVVVDRVIVRNNFFIDNRMGAKHHFNDWNNWGNWNNNVRQISWNWNSNGRQWGSFNTSQWWLRLSDTDRDKIMRFCNWNGMNNDQRTQFMLFWQSLTPSQKANLVEFWNSLSRAQQISLLNSLNNSHFSHGFSFDRHNFINDDRFSRDWHNMFSFNR